MVVNQKMLNCEQVWREISNYVDGEVDAGLRASMDEHSGRASAARRCWLGRGMLFSFTAMSAC